MNPHHAPDFSHLFATRRDFLQRCGMGLGAVAFQTLLGGDAAAGQNPLETRPPQFGGKAKHVIHIFANGGPSQVDTFDPKPMLTQMHGKDMPGEHLKTERKTGHLMKSPYSFKKYGQSGLEVSEIFSKTAESADDLCVIRSMHADVPNHEPSLLLMNCGEARLVRPSMGSWVTYGLGTLNKRPVAQSFKALAATTYIALWSSASFFKPSTDSSLLCAVGRASWVYAAKARPRSALRANAQARCRQ